MKTSYWIGYTLFAAVARAFFSYRVKDREKLIEDGPVLMVANHQSFLDPPFLGGIHEESIYFLARKTLFKGIFNTIYKSWQAIPIDQDNPDMASLKKVIALLKQGEKVLIFPEGSRSEDGGILPAMPGVGLIISKAGVPVQPMRIFGAHEALPVGCRFPRMRPVSATVGDPVAFTKEELTAKGKGAYQHLADKAMAAVRELTP